MCVAKGSKNAENCLCKLILFENRGYPRKNNSNRSGIKIAIAYPCYLAVENLIFSFLYSFSRRLVIFFFFVVFAFSSVFLSKRFFYKLSFACFLTKTCAHDLGLVSCKAKAGLKLLNVLCSQHCDFPCFSSLSCMEKRELFISLTHTFKHFPHSKFSFTLFLSLLERKLHNFQYTFM